MPFKNEEIKKLISELDLGSSVAESDNLLFDARVETSVFNDLLRDRVDLIPGTKGSGKSALFRIFVELLPDILLRERKAVIAHGVNSVGDSVFHVFNNQFEKLDENDFINFWCIYIISLVHEQFIKSEQYSIYLQDCENEIEKFRKTCQLARIPEIRAKKSLRDILGWALNVVKGINPRLTFRLPEECGELEFDFGLSKSRISDNKSKNGEEPALPQYMTQLKQDVEYILGKANLKIWIMIDKLDEIFPRRSELERKALRGLLRTMRVFDSDRIRIKIFLRDDMLAEIVSGGLGFTALTHITARRADTLKWPEDQILTMVVNRLFSCKSLLKYIDIDPEKLKTNQEYRESAFYKVFPPKVYKGSRESRGGCGIPDNSLRWI